MAASRLIPIDFRLINTVNNESVVFTMNQGEGQTIHLTISNHTSGNITIPKGVGVVSDSNYHFSLQFAPGLLADPAKVAITSVNMAAAGWKVLFKKDTQGFDVYYLLWNQNPHVMEPAKPATFPVFKLDKFKISPDLSWRHTTVALQSRALSLAGLPLPPAERRVPLTVLNTFPVDLSDMENDQQTISSLQTELIELRDVVIPPLKARIVNNWDVFRADNVEAFIIELSINPDFFGIHAAKFLTVKKDNTKIIVHPVVSDANTAGQFLKVENVNFSADWKVTNASSSMQSVSIVALKNADTSLTETKPLVFTVKNLRTGRFGMVNLRIQCLNFFHGATHYEDFDLHLPLYLGPLTISSGNAKITGAFSVGSQTTPNQFVVLENGNVGIGKPDPGTKLEIKGGGNTAIDFIVNGRMKSDNDNGGLWVSGDRFVGGVSGKIGFFNGNVWRLTVDNEGRTQLNGASDNDESGIGVLRVLAGGLPNLRIGMVNSGAMARSWIQSQGATPLHINGVGNDVIINRDAGKVGIGIASPEDKLHVNGTFLVKQAAKSFLIPDWTSSGSNPVIVGVIDGHTKGAQLRFQGVAGKGFVDVGNDKDGNFVVESNSDVARLTVLQNGNVGIGLPNPNDKLEVSGTVKASGFKIGSTTITESDLKILRKLATSQLEVKIMSGAGKILDNYFNRANSGEPNRSSQFQNDINNDFRDSWRMKLIIKP